VLLGTKDLVSSRTNKLAERFVGPYKIKKVILMNTVELELPEAVKIHLVVNVSRVHKYRDQVVGQKVVLTLPVVIEEEKGYEVEKILSKRKRYKKVEYLVCWKGYMVKEDTWEKVENLRNAQEVLRDYERGYKETTRKLEEKNNGTYRREELLGNFMAKMLYGWNNRKFKREYLKKLENN